ncbi:MAG: S46 family peptidase [Crocinitomicaceae bacterium]|nr:S46 family peptidase [Crocinitomicaceae bacterium]
MKRNFLLLAVLACLIFTPHAKADEGMWLPLLLGRNYEDMKRLGLKLTQEEIYSINNSSLKDAIVSFGGFCTAEVISKKGLLLTNHHCGYEAIADQSTEEDNILDNGFWATELNMERPIEGLTATFVISIADVSEQILKNLKDDMTEEERKNKVKEIADELVAEAIKGTQYKAYVRDFFEGNEYYLFVTETFNDVRLTGTPPESIGKFGHDTDNWMYPRHTGDFALFRIYANKENKPAAYSDKNVPYTPKHALPVSIKGIKEGDFAMVFGFPGSTDRYLSSYGVTQAIQLEQPKRVDVRAKKLEIMKKYMDQSTKVRLNYASKYAQVANYWKYFIGQTEQIKQNNVVEKKREIEARFNEFAKGKPAYENVFADQSKAYKVKDDYVYTNVYQSEYIYTVDLNVNIFRMYFVDQAFKEGNEARGNMIYTFLKNMLTDFYATAHLDLEFEIMAEVLKMYIQDIPQELQPQFVKDIAAAKGGVDRFIQRARKKSIFGSLKNFEKFDKKFNIEKMRKDPLFQLITTINAAYEEANNVPEHQAAKESLAKARRAFIKGYREMEPNRLFYPDANSTLRLTYGSILPYSPKEGVTYPITTDLSGVMEKEDPNNPEFHVSPRLKELYEAKDFGDYADENGNMVVNFISNNDITGGNSGSPVINAEGHLIGTAFDGNWEAMSGDIFFEKDIQRTISCDIRYILFIIDKYGNAQNIIDELEIIR